MPPTVSPRLGSFSSRKSFLVCRWQVPHFPHKQGAPAVETVAATADSERRKSLCPRPTSGDRARGRYVTRLPWPPEPEGDAKSRQRSFGSPWQRPTAQTQTLANGSGRQEVPACANLSTRGERSAAIGSPLEKRDLNLVERFLIFDGESKKKSSTNLTMFPVYCHALTRFTFSSYKRVYTIYKCRWEGKTFPHLLKKVRTSIQSNKMFVTMAVTAQSGSKF